MWLFNLRKQASSLFLAKIVVEQNYIGWSLRICCNGLAYSPTLTHHQKAGIGFKKPAQAFAKEAMIVHHEVCELRACYS